MLDRLTLVNKMADSFESLKSKKSQEKCPDEFFMLLASSVVNVCDTLNYHTGKSYSMSKIITKPSI